MDIVIDICEVTDYSMVRKIIQTGKSFSDKLFPPTHRLVSPQRDKPRLDFLPGKRKKGRELSVSSFLQKVEISEQ